MALEDDVGHFREVARQVAQEEQDVWNIEKHLQRSFDPARPASRKQLHQHAPALRDEREGHPQCFTSEGLQLRAAARELALHVTGLDSESELGRRVRDRTAEAISATASYWLRSEAVLHSTDLGQPKPAAAPDAELPSAKATKERLWRGSRVGWRVHWPFSRRNKPLRPAKRLTKTWLEQIVGRETDYARRPLKRPSAPTEPRTSKRRRLNRPKANAKEMHSEEREQHAQTADGTAEGDEEERADVSEAGEVDNDREGEECDEVEANENDHEGDVDDGEQNEAYRLADCEDEATWKTIRDAQRKKALEAAAVARRNKSKSSEPAPLPLSANSAFQSISNNQSPHQKRYDEPKQAAEQQQQQQHQQLVDGQHGDFTTVRSRRGVSHIANDDIKLRSQLSRGARSRHQKQEAGYSELMPLVDAARLAGIPDGIVERAKRRLESREEWSCMLRPSSAKSV
jgi:hypothetical protein